VLVVVDVVVEVVEWDVVEVELVDVVECDVVEVDVLVEVVVEVVECDVVDVVVASDHVPFIQMISQSVPSDTICTPAYASVDLIPAWPSSVSPPWVLILAKLVASET